MFRLLLKIGAFDWKRKSFSFMFLVKLRVYVLTISFPCLVLIISLVLPDSISQVAGRSLFLESDISFFFFVFLILSEDTGRRGSREECPKRVLKLWVFYKKFDKSVFTVKLLTSKFYPRVSLELDSS